MNPMRPHAAILAIGVTLAACGDSSGTGRVNMELATRPDFRSPPPPRGHRFRLAAAARP